MAVPFTIHEDETPPLPPATVLGKKLIEEIHALILESFPSARPEDILELSGPFSLVRENLDKAAAKIADQDLPKNLYAIIHSSESRSFFIGVLNYQIRLEQTDQESHRHSAFQVERNIFFITYEIRQKDRAALPRVRIPLAVVGEKLRGQGFFKKITLAFVRFLTEELGLAGAIIETRATHLVSVMRMGNLLTQARFIKIHDFTGYKIEKALEPNFIDLLWKVHILTADEAEELKNMTLSLPPYQNEVWKTQAMKIHNLFVDGIHASYQRHCQENTNEVGFLVGRIGKNFIKENPYPGDLWVEGWLKNRY